MLKISKIHMYNFKSYYGHIHIDNISNTFTAVVGPNGCGKSNIIDAILFVLGYNAKKMRHTNVGNMIYKGESSAYVEIEFLSSENEKFLLKREVSNNSCKYFINSKNISHAQYNAFLFEHNIDTTNNRFLILQGEIESIALMDNIQLLNYIEDSVNNMEYKNKLEEYEKTKNDLDSKMSTVQNEYEFVEREYLHSKKKVDELVIALESKNTQIENTIAETKDNLLEMEHNIKLNDKNIEKYEEKLKNNSKDLENIKVIKPIKTKEYFTLEKEHNEITNTIDKNISEIDIEKEQKDIDENKVEIDLIKNEIKEKTKSNKTTIEKLDEYNKNIFDLKSLINEFNDAQEHEKKYEEVLKNFEKKTKNTKYEGKQPKEIIFQMRDINRTLRDEIEKATQHNKEIDSINSNNFNNLLDNNANNPFSKSDGYIDTFLNMFDIDDEYYSAICASAGHNYSHVVTDTSSAEELMKIVRAKNMNRTTFIAYDKISVRNVENKRSIFNFIKVKEEYAEYKNIIHLFDANTLVAENIEEGRELAYKNKVRQRVVTKEGMLLEKSGIMSGGNKFNSFRNSRSKTHNKSKRVKIEKIDADKFKNELKSNTELLDIAQSVEKYLNFNKPTVDPNFNLKEHSDKLTKLTDKAEELKNKHNLGDVNKMYKKLTGLEQENIAKERSIKIFLENKTMLDRFNEINTKFMAMKEEYTNNLSSYTKNKKKQDALTCENINIGVKLEEMRKNLLTGKREIHESKKKVAQLEKELEENKKLLEMIENIKENGEINITNPVLHAYKNISEKYKRCKETYDELNIKITDIDSEIQNTNELRYKSFTSALDSINTHIKRIFNMITFGGNAEIDVVNHLDIFGEGVQLNIMPRKKTWKNIVNLSGGEKTISSISLIFAIHEHLNSFVENNSKSRKTAFYVMDEIDAALDYKNVSLISKYIQQVNAQFMVVSLRNDMFEIADTLIGVYKVEDKSRVISYRVK